MYLLNLFSIRRHSANPNQWSWRTQISPDTHLDGYTTDDGIARDIMLYTNEICVTVDPFYIHIY
jgi:hypothetical protein